MKKSILIAIATLATTSALAQNNIHYEWMENYYRNASPWSTQTINPRRVNIPGIPGYNAYKADLHMHTIFSDAQVTPHMRVIEAYMEDIDILAITDHFPAPRTDFDKGDMNVSFNQALNTTKEYPVKLIKGFEITGSDPVGHINVLFVNELNEYKMNKVFGLEECDRILAKAKAEGAFITTNHPGWPDENSDLSDYIIGHINDGTIKGIEVFNSAEFYPLAIDHSNKYGLTMLSCTDSHYPTYYGYDQEKSHRNMTIIFAKDKSDESIKEALNAGRTIAWAGDKLSGNEQLLREFLHSCIKVVSCTEKGNNIRFRLVNNSDISLYLSAPYSPQQYIYIPANGYAEAKRPKNSLSENFTVTNMYTSATGHLEIPLSFLLQDAEVCAPNVSEKTLEFTPSGMQFKLSTNAGKTYYTTDGSQPTEASILYDGGTICVPEPCEFKAVTIADGKCSEVYSRPLNFSPAVKAKLRKAGVKYTIYENDDILSTKDLVKIGRITGSGIKSDLNISEKQNTDHFGYIFTGVMKLPQTGNYRFILNTNDGSDLVIDGQMVVDNDQHNGWHSESGTIYLEKGAHTFTIRYFEGYGGDSFELLIHEPGQAKPVVMPAEYLYTE